MGCATCANGNGLPQGCKNNGKCGVSGCNKLEVFDWLSDIEIPSGMSPFEFAEVRFKNSRKDFFKNSQNLRIHQGDVVTVEASGGHDVGLVSLIGELVRVQMERKKVLQPKFEERKILRKATEPDVEKWQEARNLEQPTMVRSRQISTALGLDMKISDVEYQADKSKATFYYIAEQRVDFRELIKKLAETFKVRIEMRQIGSRQEAGRVGGIGSCGRELCCSSWLTDFRSVSTSAARYQQLAINPQKLAGQCGKLKCCLNYELDSYLEVIKGFPSTEIQLLTKKGTGVHFKSDIFKKKLWYFYKEEAGLDPIELSLERVNEIISLNSQNKKPDTLKEFGTIKTTIDDYANIVGEESLTRFDKKKSKRKKHRSNRNKRTSKK